jgi:hypothetical protein
MKHIKLLLPTDHTVVGVAVVDNESFVCVQEGALIRCTEQEAQGIITDGGKTIYQLDNKPPISIESVEIKLNASFISKSDFEDLSVILSSNDVQIENPEENDIDDNNQKTLTMAKLAADIESIKEQVSAISVAFVNDEATKRFYTTLSNPETNSIAKIRAAAQSYLDETEQQEEA